MPDGGPRCVVILTALPVEYEAVRAHLTDPHEEVHPVGTVYERGTFSAYGQLWDVGIVEIGAGNPGAAIEAERAINYFNPSLILFIGVAGGLRDVKYGDVVVATKVYGYESGRANVTFQTRPHVGNPAYSLEQRARAEAKKKDWLQRLMGPIPDPPPHVFVKPLAAGESVVTSTNSETWKLLVSSYSDALAVEMEGHGFFQAVHAYPHIDALIIRGISDLIDDKSSADANNLQEIAARHASAFAFEVLAKLKTVSNQPGRGTETTASNRRGQPYETQQPGILNQREIGGVSPEAFTEELLRGFRMAFSQYTGKIQTILNFVDTRRNISPSWCKSAIRWLDTIDEHVQRLRSDAPALSVLDRVMLVDIHDQISALKLELQTFRRPRWFIKVPQRRLDENGYERIRTMCRALLKDLEQFNQRP